MAGGEGEVVEIEIWLKRTSETVGNQNPNISSDSLRSLARIAECGNQRYPAERAETMRNRRSVFREVEVLDEKTDSRQEVVQNLTVRYNKHLREYLKPNQSIFHFDRISIFS